MKEENMNKGRRIWKPRMRNGKRKHKKRDRKRGKHERRKKNQESTDDKEMRKHG